MYDEIIALIKEVTTGQDDIGNPIKKMEEREVFAERYSIGQNEFYQAAVSSLRPEAKFIIADYMDYNGEEILEYKEYGAEKKQRYSIIRTYRKGNELEITCRREMGK